MSKFRHLKYGTPAAPAPYDGMSVREKLQEGILTGLSAVKSENDDSKKGASAKTAQDAQNDARTMTVMDLQKSVDRAFGLERFTYLNVFSKAALETGRVQPMTAPDTPDEGVWTHFQEEMPFV